MDAQPRPQTCIYCGNNVRRVRRGKGDHIIPKIIGGALTIKNVCQQCNNDILSPLEKELCSRSPLSIIASQEIDAHIWQTWDVDHESHNLLLEAMPIWETKSYKLYPQIIFERNGPQVRGDLIEMQQFGHEDYGNVFIKSMLKAYKYSEAGETKWLHFERVEPNTSISRKYRFPPRIFCTYTIEALARRYMRGERASFKVRYLCEADRRFALNTLDNWNVKFDFGKHKIGIGSHYPEIRCFHDSTKTLRALEKIAINILAHICQNTPVNKTSFEHIIKVITGENPITLQMWQRNGFVYPPDIDHIKCPNGGHTFRLLHTNGEWHVISSFFGGKICSFIVFPGPNNEEWCTANIQAPIRNRNWTITTSTILQPLDFHYGWQDMSKIIPSVAMVNPRSELHIEYGQ